MEFKLQLWRINRHWDNKHLSGYDIYSINEVGHSEIVNITSIEEFESVQMKTEAKINVTTIGVEKANTIAIYETNGTVFNGHYQEQERMNIIQLYVNDSGAGTPFVEGSNVIVIPTSLFTETIFNAYVQNETLDETAIYSSDDEIFKFISVGRDGNTEQACDEIDFVFIRFNISSQDAMQILNLLLECLVNETTNETAIVYSYASTKINGTLAVMMNLPISVLGFILWFCNFENSIIGSKPETKSDVFWNGIKKLVSLAVGLIVIIGMAILELVELIAEFVMEILMEWLPILEFILWLIICTIVLILVWIDFAINLLIIFISFLTMIIMVELYNEIFDAEIKIKTNSATIKNKHNNIEFGYDQKMVEFKPLKLTIPSLNLYIDRNNTKYEMPMHFFSGLVEPLSLQLFENLFNISEYSESLSAPVAYSSKLTDFFLDSLKYIVDGMIFTMAIFSILMSICGVAGQSSFGIPVAIGAIFTLLMTIYFFYNTYLGKFKTLTRWEDGTLIIWDEERIPPGINPLFIIGILIGLLITFEFNNILVGSNNLITFIAKTGLLFLKLGTLSTIIGVILGFLGLTFSDFAILLLTPKSIIGFGTLCAATVSIFLTPDNIKDKLAKTFRTISIWLFIILVLFYILPTTIFMIFDEN